MNYFVQSAIRQDIPRHPFAYDSDGKPKLAIHLGKSIYGQCFNLRVYPKYGINTWSDWEEIIDHRYSFIYNQLEELYSNKYEFSVLIVNSRYIREPLMKGYRDTFPKYLIDGPNNLLRHPIGYNNCIGHGEGTYDCFSDMVID